mmetsp:Transcript_9347/g.23786  ORF Transcript_9347/g.23786 Transcript_9347/m.23786 type:complete len:254 (+) Transcript_9347:64-825(+)
MSAAMSARLSRFSSGCRNWSIRAADVMKSRSTLSVSPMPGLSTFTATSRPLLRSTARCTTATDALAMGVSSNCVNVVVSGAPVSCSTMRRTSSKGTGGAWSRHFWNSSTYSGGNIVGAEATNCPSFMYVAPSFSQSRLSTLGGDGSSANAAAASAAAAGLCAARVPTSALSSVPTLMAASIACAVRNAARGPARTAVAMRSCPSAESSSSRSTVCAASCVVVVLDDDVEYAARVPACRLRATAVQRAPAFLYL